MKRLAMILILIMTVITVGCGSSRLCQGEGICQKMEVRSQVEAAPGELSLADLLAPGTCARWYRLAARVSLGAVPRAGSERVLEGEEIRRLIHGIEDRGPNRSADEQPRIPERIVVRQSRAAKSCAEIARVISQTDPALAQAGGRPELTEKDLDCAAAGNISQDSTLELMTARWNAGLQRREYALRCRRAEDCIPFLVWGRGDNGGSESAKSFLPRNSEGATSGRKEAMPLIRTGQTVMLTWDEAGIRVVLPVTCLQAGGLGQRVQVRFKNAPRTLQAEIVGAGMVRATL